MKWFAFLFFGIFFVLNAKAALVFESAPNFLLIGDSHIGGPIGEKLDDLLRSVPEAKVATYASSSSSPSWWIYGTATKWGYFQKDLSGHSLRSKVAQTPLLKNLMAKQCPGVVLIALGANMVPLPSKAEVQTRALLEVVATLQGKCVQKPSCFWLGPPHSRIFDDPEKYGNNFNEIYDLLARLTREAGCSLIDQRPFAKYPSKGGDGLHYNQVLGPDGLKLAHQIAEQAFAKILSR